MPMTLGELHSPPGLETHTHSPPSHSPPVRLHVARSCCSLLRLRYYNIKRPPALIFWSAAVVSIFSHVIFILILAYDATTTTLSLRLSRLVFSDLRGPHHRPRLLYSLWHPHREPHAPTPCPRGSPRRPLSLRTINNLPMCHMLGLCDQACRRGQYNPGGG